jgi:hypothetical protein
MSKQRKSFILHYDSLNVLDELANEQGGLLFKAIKAYHLGDDIELDGLTKIAMSPFKNQFERDDEKYKKLCEKNRLIAERRYGTKSTTGESGNQSIPKGTKSTDNDSDNDSDSDSDSKKEVTKDIVATAPKFNFKKELLKLGVEPQVLDDWLTVRKKKRASNTKTAFNLLMSEIKKSGLMVNDAIEYAASKSWSGFKAEWWFNENKVSQIKPYSDVTAQNIKNLEGGW